MNIPLINSNSKQDINTSLIAIRNAINELSRMKESASVEDLQRQINIINQQITNFNSEFSAINTHLNTIDTNILNLQPVDTVASGNLHSVTSNAVANLFRALERAPNNDANQAIAIGSYSINIETLNVPNVIYGVLFVLGKKPETPSSTEQWITQILFEDDGNVYFRQSINSNSVVPSNWTDWRTLYSKNKLKYYTGVSMTDADTVKTLTIPNKEKCNVVTLNSGSTSVCTSFIMPYASSSNTLIYYNHPTIGFIGFAITVTSESATGYTIEIRKTEDTTHRSWDIIFWSLL